MYPVASIQNTDGSWNFEKILALKDDRQDFKDTGNGMERKPLFFCGAFRTSWDEKNKQFEVGINHYHKDGIGELQIKVHGGCSKLGETPRRALQREAKEETGRFMSPTAPVIFVHVFRYKDEEIAADPNKYGMIEHIHIFFYDEVPYENRNKFFRTVNGSDMSEETQLNESSPIKWMVLNSELIESVFYTHYNVFRLAHRHMVSKYRGIKDVEKARALHDIYFTKK